MEGCAVEVFATSWIEMRRQRQKRIRQSVEAYTASWIEIQLYLQLHQQKMVEAYTASWIEMVEKADVESPNTSRLI